MSTSSRIGVEDTDGKVRAIYCHFDGFPESVGSVLFEHYTSPELVEELIALGDISMLRPCVRPDEGYSYSNHDPDDDVTVAYHRDRGEDFTAALVYDSKSAYAETFGESFCYLFSGGQWLVKWDDDFIPIPEALADEESC